VLLVAPWAGAQTPPPAARAVTYPHAGIALVLPEGFAVQPNSDPFVVLRAVRPAEGTPMQAVSLAAYSVAPKITTEAYADAIAEQLKADLAFRNLESLNKTPMPVAGLTGSAWRMRYTYRDMDTVAARLYFIRDLKNGPARICYVLTVEATPALEETLLPTLADVIKSVQFVPVQSPTDLPLDAAGPPIVDKARGYTMRPPAGWFAGRGPAGAFLGQADYRKDGQTTLMAYVLTEKAPSDADIAAATERFAERALEQARRRGLAAEVHKKGKAELDGFAGWQFVLLQKPIPASQPTSGPSEEPAAETAPAEVPAPPQEVTLVHRSVCVPVAPDASRIYSLVLIAHDVPPEQAMAVMNGLAKGLDILVEPATQPTSEPASAPASALTE